MNQGEVDMEKQKTVVTGVVEEEQPKPETETPKEAQDSRAQLEFPFARE
jgi:hypothetical protein